MDRFDAIRLFTTLVECGSFSGVGRAEGIGQPAVSKQIAGLERYLGVQLVLRTSRQLAITDAGRSFYQSAKRLLDDFDALESSVGELQRSPRGLVRINTAPGHGRLCVTPSLPKFLQRYPEITVEVSASETHIDLLSEGFDLAIRHGRLVDSGLTARKLGETEMVLAASPAYIASHGAPSSFADLNQHACIVFARGRESRPWSLKVGRKITSYLPHGAFVTGDAEHVRAAVLSGLGISQAPHWLLAKEIQSGEVKILLPQLQPGRLPMHVVYAAGRRIPARVRVFIEHLVSTFRPVEQAPRPRN